MEQQILENGYSLSQQTSNTSNTMQQSYTPMEYSTRPTSRLDPPEQRYPYTQETMQPYFDQSMREQIDSVSAVSSPPYANGSMQMDMKRAASGEYVQDRYRVTQEDLLLSQQMSNMGLGFRGRPDQQIPMQMQQQIPMQQPMQQADTMGVVATATAVANANTSFSSQSSMQITNPLNFTSAPSRTVYLGNIPPNATVKDLLDHVRSGVVEEIKILPEKMCAFVSFVDESAALLFHSDAILKRLNIDGRDIKIGWGKSARMDPIVAAKIAADSATRNVYFGHLNEEPIVRDEETLRRDLAQFGPIDTVKFVRDKGIAFVHLASIGAAISVVTNLPNINTTYAKKRVFYGKDRCAFITKTQQHNAAQFLGIQSGADKLAQFSDREFISNALLQQSAAAAAIATSAGGPNNLGNRTIYLGNLPKDIRVEDICNVVRGGLLQNIKLLSDRFVCFVTFIDPTAAAQFYAMSSLHGLTIQKKRCKVGWGKHSGPLPNALTLAVGNGASRNIYIGNIDMSNTAFFNEHNLRSIFRQYGEVEQINFLPEKRCCFVNFTNINNAILCLDKIKSLPEFKDLKVNYGKDRCGNVPHQVR